ncbi:MAG: hypothetical protein K1X68_06145 [Saprospiraceae bacterium]|nr:hypothetical protein [Saprospiraceae bacterium]MBX7176333.1 hypothetical protein [Saprospiraceae bacterium]HMW39216.1 hypothetical protein [Saprospiraceae bacterium]HMX88970.1 hypothetical protein [Saprospiraceae bacterium]HMZ40861.1 hypothetical protein [Saprospiraceae bacterium]
MGILDKIKSVFIVPEDNPGSANTVAASSTATTSQDTQDTGVSMSSENRQKFYELLSGILEKNNLPGYDYLEYKKALQSVAKLANMDEANVYRTVFAAAQAMNVDVAHLMSTANSYLSVLETEQAKFHQAADKFLADQVQNKSSDIKSTQQKLDDSKKQLETLHREIEELEKNLAILTSDLSQVQAKIAANKADFNSNYVSFVDEIRKDIQKMKQYLQ